LHHGEITGRVGFGEAGEGGVEGSLFLGTQFESLVFAKSEGGTGAPVVVVTQRDDGVEAIVAAGQLENDENVAVFTRDPLDELSIGGGMEREHGVLEKAGNRPREGAAQQSRAEEFPTRF
jgi:hypothetical protein